MAQRILETDIQSLVQLIVHYCDGKEVPLDTEVLSMSVSPILQRWVMLWCKSSKWMSGGVASDGSLAPLHIRFEGGRVMTMGNKGEDPKWALANEDPKRQ